MRSTFRASAGRPTRMIGIAIVALLLAATGATLSASGTQAADQEGVRRAALDYLEGFYEGDSTKLMRSVRPDVYKIGFARQRDSSTYGPQSQMTWSAFLDFARNVRTQNRQAPATAPKEVQLLDVLDQTAAAKVTAWWGTDYLLLGKFGGRWMITHVIWQSPPPRK